MVQQVSSSSSSYFFRAYIPVSKISKVALAALGVFALTYIALTLYRKKWGSGAAPVPQPVPQVFRAGDGDSVQDSITEYALLRSALSACYSIQEKPIDVKQLEIELNGNTFQYWAWGYPGRTGRFSGNTAIGGHQIIYAIVEHQGERYFAWFTDSVNGRKINAINIELDGSFCSQVDIDGRKPKKLGIKISEQGVIKSLMLNAKDRVQKIPDEWDPIVKSCLEQVLVLSSMYGESLEDYYVNEKVVKALFIELVPYGLLQIPLYHLEMFTRRLSYFNQTFNPQPNLRVTFNTYQMKKERGIDAGGLTREYLNNLFKGLTCKCADLFDKMGPSLLTLSCPEDQLDEEKKQIYHRIGQVLMYCYNSKTEGYFNVKAITGVFFHNAVFAAALALTSQEIDSTFERLEVSTKLRMAKAYVNQWQDEQMMKGSLPFIQFALGEVQMSQLEETIKKNFPGSAFQETVENFGLEFQNNQLTEDSLTNLLFPFKDRLAAIYALAGGMKSLCAHPLHQGDVWDRNLHTCKAQDFGDQAQGNIDPKLVADQLTVDNSSPQQARRYIQKRIGWIKEWLLDPATPSRDIKLFLKYITGSEGVSFAGNQKPQEILVGSKQSGDDNLQPEVHSCKSQILFCIPALQSNQNEQTRDDFLKILFDSMVYDSQGTGQI